MKISYLVTCCNEKEELRTLLAQLTAHIAWHNTGDEIVILQDDSNVSLENEDIIKQFTDDFAFVKLYKHKLSGDFGIHKNYGSKLCKNPWIVQADADERFSSFLLINLADILEANPTVELFRVPRVNIVHGATQADAIKWGWHMSTLPEFGDAPIINWENSGDYQSRIYRNLSKIHWHKPLHETITGHEVSSAFPREVDFAIIHEKTLARQTAQNEFYNRNWSSAANMGQG